MPKKTIIFFIVLAAAVFVIWQIVSNNNDQSYELVVVERAAVTEQVTSSAQIVAADKIDLQFEIAGKIKEIRAAEGDMVGKNVILALLDTTQLYNEVDEAEAARDVANAQLNQLLAGASDEEIDIYKTALANSAIALDNAQINLANKQQNLKDAQDKADTDLDQDYEDALDVLDTVYTVADKAWFTFEDMRAKYFYYSTGISGDLEDESELTGIVFETAKAALNTARADASYSNVDLALINFKSALVEIRDSLGLMKQAMDDTFYESGIAAADETLVDTERTNIDSAITDIISASQAIESQKVTNQININTAQSAVDTAQSTVNTEQGDFRSSQDDLDKVTAPSRQTDIDLYEAQVDQAQAKVTRLEHEIQKAILRSPIKGQVIEVEKEIGEAVLTTETVISLISENNFQIKADIYEEDIVKVNPGDLVDVTIVALPEDILSAKVVAVNPAEKLVDNVVYYEVTMELDQEIDELKPGMSADVVINTAFRNNALVLPQSALMRKNGKIKVDVLKDNGIQEKEVVIGLEGGNDMVEIIAGLEQGDQVIIR